MSHENDTYHFLEERLDKYVAEQMKENENKLLKSKMLLGGIPVDGIPMGYSKIEPRKIRPWPKLYYDNGEPIKQLHFSNLPSHMKWTDIQNLLWNFGVKPLRVTVKNRHSNHNDSIAFVSLIPEHILDVQILGRENKLRFNNRIVRVNPVQQNIPSIKPADDIDVFLRRLPLEIVETFYPKNVKDQLALICSSKTSAQRINVMKRPLIISPENVTQETVKTLSLDKFLRLISPCNAKSNFSKICLINNDLCKNISPDIVLSLFKKHTISGLVEVNLSGVQFTPSVLACLTSCRLLEKLCLGDSNGPFDQELSIVIQRVKSLKFISVQDNISFTSSALTFCQYTNLESIEITRCYKLHNNHLIQFMRESQTLKRVKITDSRQVNGSPTMKNILDILPFTTIHEFQLIYTSKDEFPGEIKYWEPVYWTKPAEHLQKLVINGLILDDSISELILQSTMSFLPSLKYLDISGHDLQYIDLPWYLLYSLEELIMNNVRNIHENFWTTKFLSLRRIDLKSIKYLSRSKIIEFININLETLDNLDLTKAKLEKLPHFFNLRLKPIRYNSSEIKSITNNRLFKN